MTYVKCGGIPCFGQYQAANDLNSYFRKDKPFAAGEITAYIACKLHIVFKKNTDRLKPKLLIKNYNKQHN